MVEESKNQGKNYEKFIYGALASRFLKSETDKKYTQGALDVLAKELKLSEDAIGFVEGSYASEESIERATQIYANMFAQSIANVKPSELLGIYNPLIKDLDDSEKSKIEKVIKSQEETIGEIQKKVVDADYKLQAPQGTFKDEELEKSKKILEKYNTFINVQQTLDSYKFESLRNKAVEATRKRDIKGLVSKL